jgi:hypothetical protein
MTDKPEETEKMLTEVPEAVEGQLITEVPRKTEIELLQEALLAATDDRVKFNDSLALANELLAAAETKEAPKAKKKATKKATKTAKKETKAEAIPAKKVHTPAEMKKLLDNFSKRTLRARGII